MGGVLNLAITLAGGVVGAELGPTLGISQALGFQLGGLAGGILGGALLPMPVEKMQGPRLSDRSSSLNSQGDAIPWGFGLMPQAGEYIWCLPQLTEIAGTLTITSTGAPTTETTEYLYYQKFAVAFGEGVGTIKKIWMDTKVVYDVSATSGTTSVLFGGSPSSATFSTTTGVWYSTTTTPPSGGAFQEFHRGDVIIADTGGTLSYWQFIYPSDVLPMPGSGWPRLGIDWNGIEFWQPYTGSLSAPATSRYPAPALYSGTGTQSPDPTIRAYIPDYPAQRGMIYAVWGATSTDFPNGFPLKDFGNTLPRVVRALIDYGDETKTVEYAVKQTCLRAGIDERDIDTSGIVNLPLPGYLVSRITDGRTIINQLGTYAFFDGYESDFQLKFQRRGLLPPPGITPPTKFTGNVAGSIPEGASWNTDQWEIASVAPHQLRTHYQPTTLTLIDPVKFTKFGLNVPTGATIVGVVVTIRYTADAATDATLENVQLLYNGSVLGDEQTPSDRFIEAFQTMTWPLPDPTTGTISGFLWGATLTPAIVNSSTFGFQVKCKDHTVRLFLDIPTIGVFYQPAVTFPSTPTARDPVMTIPEDDLGLEGEGAALEVQMTQSLELPAIVQVNYLEALLDYTQGKQEYRRSDRVLDSQQQVSLDLPIPMNKDQAKQIAQNVAYLAALERKPFQTKLWKAVYQLLDPSDLVGLVYHGTTQNVRVAEGSIGQNFVADVKLISEDARNYISYEIGAVTTDVPGTALPPAPPAPTFFEDFTEGLASPPGTLDPAKWNITTASGVEGSSGTNTGSFDPANVDLSTGMLRIKLEQTGSVGAWTSVGGQISTVDTFGYGTYEWVARTSSVATTPTGAGSARSGSVSSLSNFLDGSLLSPPTADYTAIDFDVEGQSPSDAEFASWIDSSTEEQDDAALVDSDQGFHSYKYVWTVGRIDFYLDGVLKSTHTTDVPTVPANVFISHFGTDDAGFGGTATASTRYLYISSFSFTAA